MLSDLAHLLHHDLIRQLLRSPLSLLISAIFLFIVAASTSINHLRGSSSRIPLYEDGDSALYNPKKQWVLDAMNVLRKGHKKYGNKPFQVVTTEGNVVILPPDLLDEVKMLPNKYLPSWLQDLLQSKHTGLGGPAKPGVLISVIKHNLVKNMVRMFPEVKEEVDDALLTEFPACEDWVELKISMNLLRTICRVSGSAFVGAKLNRDEEWIQINIDYTRNIFGAAGALRSYSPPMRYIAKYFLSEMKVVRAQHAKAEKILTPIIKERNEAELLRGYEKPTDTIEWGRDAMKGKDKEDYHFQTLLQLGISAAAFHTTSATTLAVLYNLATHPEYLAILRAEAEEVRKAAGGEFTLESMGQLKKLDSFIKESQRVDPIIVAAAQRKAMKPLTFSDGTYIPKDTVIMAATEALSSDPTYYPKPDEFDGLRFYHLRQQSPELEKRSQFASTSKTHLHFGTGRHACPGRWFASHEIKLVVTSFIERYDIKLKKGEGRPKNLRFQHTNFPDPNGKILLKSREV